jgi:hypothetical protein
MIVIKGGDCVAPGGLLSPAYWALNLTQFFRLVKESWRIVLSRENSSHQYFELAANFAFPTSGLLSIVVEQTWKKFVSKRFLHESLLFLRDFALAATDDLADLKAEHDKVRVASTADELD